jgi:hypothetical protein
MTPQEHAENIRKTLRKAERALRRHHEALRCAAEECGEAVGIAPEFGEPKDDQ